MKRKNRRGKKINLYCSRETLQILRAETGCLLLFTRQPSLKVSATRQVCPFWSVQPASRATLALIPRLWERECGIDVTSRMERTDPPVCCQSTCRHHAAHQHTDLPRQEMIPFISLFWHHIHYRTSHEHTQVVFRHCRLLFTHSPILT